MIKKLFNKWFSGKKENKPQDDLVKGYFECHIVLRTTKPDFVGMWKDVMRESERVMAELREADEDNRELISDANLKAYCDKTASAVATTHVVSVYASNDFVNIVSSDA